MAADINFYGLLYEFHRTSTNGADILITIEKKWYEGEVKQRALGRAPVIKRENKDHIFGTSCELYAECLVDGEYADMYTSDPYEFRVSVYKDETLLWQGYVSPELYSEPDAAPPYDVQITATDGLGELKNSIYEERGAASILSHIMGLIGQYPIYVISGLRYVDSTGAISQDHDILNVRINLDHEKGNSKYDVLQNLLTSLNANITQLNGRYVIFRETDFINKATDEGVEAFDVNGEKVYISIASFGSMTSHQWWPIGQLSTVVEPAKNSLVLQAPNHYKDNVLDFSQWSILNSAEYDATEDAYILPDEGSYITQALDFDNEVGYRLGLRIRARNVGDSEEDQNIGLMIKVNARTYSAPEGRDFWLVKSEVSTGNARTDYLWRGQEDYFEEALNMPSDADTASDAQNVDIVIPLYDHSQNGLSYIFASSLSIKIFNPAGIHDIYVYDVSLVKYEQSEGYEAKVVINNAAREAESDIDLSMSSASFAPAAGNMFMTGLPMQADGLLIEQWQIPGSAAQEYLSAMSYDYARAVALPKMKYSGVLNVPDTATILPILFLRDGTYYFPKTYTYDLYNDEIQVELISISAADVSLSSVVISQYAESSGNMGGVTTGGGGGGSVISLPRDKVMSDTSDNAVENRVIKAYVDSEVKDLADLLTSMWRIEDDKIVTDMDVLVKANLIVSGDTSSGGEGQDTPAEGTVTGIEVNGTPYEPNTQGVIDLSAAFNAIDVSDQLKDVVDALEEAIGKKADKATTLAEYGITDANISNGVITLGANTITPLTTIYSLRLNNSAGEQIVKFEPNVKSSEINLTKAMVGLDLVENTKLSTWAGTNNITTLGTITSGTWQGSRVSKSYLDSDLVAWFDAVSPLLVKDSSGNIKISTNLIVTGDTSSGGSGSDTPASGTVTGVTVGSTDYTDVNAGLLNLTSLMNLYTPLTSHNALATRVSTLEGGSATAISVTGSGNVISGVSKSGTTITFTKGVTALTNITKSMVDSVLGSTTAGNANRFLMSTGSTSVWAAISKTNVTDALGYTPLSTGGGTLTGSITLSGGYLKLISVGKEYGYNTNSANGEPLYLKDDNWFTLLHSGNYSDYALKIEQVAQLQTDNSWIQEYALKNRKSFVYNSSGDEWAYLIGLNDTSEVGAILRMGYSSATLQVKTVVNGTWSGWKSVAFLTSTVANAAKVAGTDVSFGLNKPWGTIPAITNGGYMDVGRHFEFHYDNTTGSDFSTILQCTGNYSNMVSLPSASGTLALLTDNVASAQELKTSDGTQLVHYNGVNTLYVGGGIYANAQTDILGKKVILRYGASATNGLILNKSGNVTIGGSDSGITNAKLYVDGRVYSKSAFLFDGDYGIWKGRQYAGSLVETDIAYNATKHYFTGGNVGIGTASPAYKLDVAGTGNFSVGIKANEVLLGSAGLYKGSYWTSSLSDNDMVINGGKISIRGEVTMSNELFLGNNMGIYFKNASGTNVLAMYVSPSNVLQVGYNNVDSVAFQKPVTMSSTLSVGGNITPSSNNSYDIGSNTYMFRYHYVSWVGSKSGSNFLMGAGNGNHVLIDTSGNMRPYSNNAFTLGTSSYQWSTIYGVNGVFSGAVSIGNTLTVTAGGAKVTGDTTINGNLVVSGDVASA